MKRRSFLAASSAGMAVAALPLRAQQLLPAHDMEALIRGVAGAATVRRGRIVIALPQLAENGNSVPLDLSVDSPMSEADHVRIVHIFAERNPRPLVASFRFGATAGLAKLSTRIRLAGTQRVVAIALMADGSCWLAETEVVVTTAACLDEMSL